MEYPQTVSDQRAKIPASADNIDRTLEFRALAEMIPALVFMTDATGANVYVNAQFQRYCGVAQSSLLGEGWLSALHPDDRSRAAETWHRTWALGEPYDVRYRFRRFDGDYRWHLVRGTPLKDADGAVVRWIGSCTDVDDLVGSVSFLDPSLVLPNRDSELIRLSREILLLKAQIDSLPEICWIADDRGTIVSVNEAWHFSSLAPRVDMAFGDLITTGSYPSFIFAWEFSQKSKAPLNIEVEIHDRLAGGPRPAKVTAFAHRIDQGGQSETYWVGTIV